MGRDSSNSSNDWEQKDVWDGNECLGWTRALLENTSLMSSCPHGRTRKTRLSTELHPDVFFMNDLLDVDEDDYEN